MPDLNRSAIPLATAPLHNSAHWEPETVSWSEIQDWMAHPARKKECGGYILASLRETTKVHAGGEEPCTEYHRDTASVARRSAVLVLDLDSADPSFEVDVAVALDGVEYLWHTTYSSTPDHPRYRLMVLADRDMAPDEYVVAARALADRVGPEQVDHGSYEATRFMFRPSARKKSWFRYETHPGEPIAVESLLEEFQTNLSDMEMPPPSRFKRDPFTLADPMGAFNRAYADWATLIKTYDLPYDQVEEDRWQLHGAASEAGMGPVPGAEGLVYSHHASDPAFGRACSAFDLVRLHWFGELDEGLKPGTPVNRSPSHIQMCDVASRDRRVVAEIFDAMTSDMDMSDAAPIPRASDAQNPTPSGGWKSTLRVTPTGRFADNVQNLDVLRHNDPILTSLYLNQMTGSRETDAEQLPWRQVTKKTRYWTEVDDIELRFYFEREYGAKFSRETVESLVVSAASQRPHHPIRDYLENLKWDGVRRVRYCLPGTENTPYNAMVARKVMTGAIARIMEPGVQWDHTLILYGPQGIGKTTWIRRMASVGIPDRRMYMSQLGDIRMKDTLVSMGRSWIMTSDEGHSLNKAESDALKEFLTRSHDVYRAPYARAAEEHPRQCVIWSTTNDDTILRRQDGNRRFLIVRCQHRVDLSQLTDEYVDQVWAEAYAMYLSGQEKLYLDKEEFAETEKEQQPFLEENSIAGVVEEYLDRLVPEDWWEMSPTQRLQWISDRDAGFEKPGTMQVDMTCTHQLWTEALGQRNPPQRGDLLHLSKSLKELGWVSEGTQRVPGYGSQVRFRRLNEEDLI